MKKFFLIISLLSIPYFTSCKAKAHGFFTIKNNSSYNLSVSLGQNYQIITKKVDAGDNITIEWTNYRLFFTDPSDWRIKYPIIKSDDTEVTIKNNTNKYKYTINNAISKATIKDNLKIKEEGQFILCNSSGVWTPNYEVACTAPDIYYFKQISKDDIAFNKGANITIDGKNYQTFEKIGSNWYYNENAGGKLKRTKIEITIDNDIKTIKLSE